MISMRPWQRSPRPIQRIDVLIIHNVLWAHYKGAVFSELSKLLIAAKIDTRFVHIALTERDRQSLGEVDRSAHQYKFEVLFDEPFEAIGWIRKSWALIGRILRYRPQLVVISGYYDLGYWFALLAARSVGSKVIVTVDSTERDKARYWWTEWPKRYFLRFCERAFCYGEASRDYLLLLGMAPERGKDPTGGQNFVISQETTGAYSAPGCLKMAITPGADTLTKCTISGSITGLTANRIIQITGMVKYADMPAYYNAMISFVQVNMTAPSYTWNQLKWGTLWGNNPGASDWTQFTATDTVKDSANVFRLAIFQSNAGTLWVDDIAVTYTDPVLQKAVQTARQCQIVNNRIVFPSATPYTLEAFGMNGKTVLKRSATAMTVDLNRLELPGSVYLVKVAAAGKTWSKKVLIGKQHLVKNKADKSS